MFFADISEVTKYLDWVWTMKLFLLQLIHIMLQLMIKSICVNMLMWSRTNRNVTSIVVNFNALSSLPRMFLRHVKHFIPRRNAVQICVWNPFALLWKTYIKKCFLNVKIREPPSVTWFYSISLNRLPITDE